MSASASMHSAAEIPSTQALASRGRTLGKSQRWRYAYAAFIFCLATAVAGYGQTFTTLVSFTDTARDGSEPAGMSLVQGFDGKLYGTTSGRIGPPGGGGGPNGTVFKITTGGALTALRRLCESNCSTPDAPVAGVILGTDGNFYGTTAAGGFINSKQCGGDCGTVFKITSGGTLTTLYEFCSTTRSIQCPDGETPTAPLVQGADGNFYGTTLGGGKSTNCATQFLPPGCGTVFKITPQGVLTTLHSFCVQTNCPDGAAPNGLVQGRDGNFYGTTGRGESTSDGTVFKITASGMLTTLHSFDGTDGLIPAAGLIQAIDGDFYGTTEAGGTGANCDFGTCGTVFKMTPSGTLTTLYSFCSQTNCTDGGGPQAPLVQATDGNLYGTTAVGGSGNGFCASFKPSGCGTVFKITPSGTLTTLHVFDGSDGAFVADGLVQATGGNFYGTTQVGGTGTNCSDGCGVVFKLSVALGPFVRTLPGSGKVGDTISILGTNLTGASSVNFHGTAAKFTVVSSSRIITQVPAGATTGKVTVTTPGGTVRSNLAFQILP